MGTPTAPPLSVRFGDVRLAEIDAYATKHGLKRHAAILELIDVGLKGLSWVACQRPTPKPIPGSLAAERKAARASNPTSAERTDAAKINIQVGPVSRKPGSMLDKRGKK